VHVGRKPAREPVFDGDFPYGGGADNDGVARVGDEVGGRRRGSLASATIAHSAIWVSSNSLATTGHKQTMVIKREDVDGRRVNFSDVQSGRRLPPVHPGTILRNEFLAPMSISVYELANSIKAPRSRVNDIVRGRRAISTDTALRLGRYFGTSPEFWINLQAHYDLDVADRTTRRRIERSNRALHERWSSAAARGSPASATIAPSAI